MPDPDYRKRLRRLRTRAKLRGISVLTTRRAISPQYQGGVMLTDIVSNSVIAGSRFDLSIADAEERVAELVSDIEAKSLRFGGGR